MLRTHLIKATERGRSFTFCGRAGWSANVGADEYEDAGGERFVAVDQPAKTDCGTCKRLFALQWKRERESIKQGGS